MAREIIILDFVVTGSTGYAVCAFWLVAPANRIVPRPGFASEVPSTAPFSLTAGETTALQNGTTVEQIYVSGQWSTLALIQADVQNAYGVAQTKLTNSAFSTKLPGASWDGTTWTLPP